MTNTSAVIAIMHVRVVLGIAVVIAIEIAIAIATMKRGENREAKVIT